MSIMNQSWLYVDLAVNSTLVILKITHISMGYAKFFEDNERITTERKYEREIIYSIVQNKIY